MQFSRWRVRFRSVAAIAATLVLFASSAHAQASSLARTLLGKTATTEAELAAQAATREGIDAVAARAYGANLSATHRYLGESLSPALDEAPWRSFLSSDERAVLKSLDEYAPGLAPEPIAPDVESFAKGFSLGAKDPGTNLERIEISHPDLYRGWVDAPEDMRVFLIGAGTDAALVSTLSGDLEREGFRTFFYQFCLLYRILCPPEAIGAFAITARYAIVVDTRAAAQSRFVRFEVAKARTLRPTRLNPPLPLQNQFGLQSLLAH